MFRDSPAFSGFAVPDLEQARGFYGGTLGLDARTGEMGTFELHLGGGTVVFVYEKPDHVPATYTVLNFPVQSVEAAVDALAVAGVEMQRYPGFGQDERGISRGNGPTIAWFTDPAGNILSVLETGQG